MDQKKDKVLIVDDESRNIFALKAVLTAKGFSCISATTAEEGLQIASNQKDIGIILMDMMLPQTDGYEAISIIRKDPQLKEIPVIAVTAQAMKGDKEKCLNAGADNYISKPIDVDLLLNLLKLYLK
ncbi:response regulator [Rubrolithibacter danxiaensis]|uniref:response regulator n=1 Tax=Rubrolithibacter danxiaensis TaxID=3390805 RepID=UPI003BF810B7